MNVKISTTNSKLSGQIPSVNLPAVHTCRHDAPCKHLCYARKGNFTFPNVKASHMNNLACFVSNPEEYFNDIISFLNGLVSYRYFRWHSSGDIVNYDYLLGMVRVAKKCKSVKFLCFTKKFELVNQYLASNEKLPSNLHIVFSAWDKNFKVENPFNLPVTYVDFIDTTMNPEIPELAIPCTGDCPSCLACWSLKKGQAVVFHQHQQKRRIQNIRFFSGFDHSTVTEGDPIFMIYLFFIHKLTKNY